MKAYIKAISYYLPEKKLTNEELSQIFPEWTAEEIYKRTGVRERGISPLTELSSDRSVKAAEKLFQEHRIDKSEIDFLIFCTHTPDYIAPATACVIQQRLGLPKNIGAMDVGLGCTGFIYILSMAKGLVETGMAKNILLLNSESITRFIHPDDRSSRCLFGDAATATLVSERKQEGISRFVFGTNGAGKDMMIIKAGGMRYPANESSKVHTDEYGNVCADEYFYIDGMNVVSFSIEVSVKMMKELLAVTRQSKEDIDYFVFHQGGGLVLELLQKKLNIPKEKFCIDLSNTGNTGSCTIPIALRNSMDSLKIKKGNKVMLVSFGVGLSWAATVMTV